MRLDKKRIVGVLVVALVLSQALEAQSDPNKSNWTATFQMLQDLITSYPRDYVNSMMGTIMSGLRQNPTFYCPRNTAGVLLDPTCKVTAGIDILTNKWIDILVPFYIIAFLFTGLFLLLKAGTPRGRARARAMFLKLLIGMVVVALSPVIYQVMIESSVVMVRFFLDQYGTEINLGIVRLPVQATLFPAVTPAQINGLTNRLNNSGLGLSCIFVYMSLFIFILSGVVLWTRNTMIIFYGVFFPVIIFLYSFEITKPQGEKWLNASLKWIYTPPLQALFLAFSISIANSISVLPITGSIGVELARFISNSMAGTVVLAGLFAFALAPMIIGQVMSWFGDAIAATGLGTGRQWMVGVGSLLAGGGSGAIIQSNQAAARGASEERYMASMMNTPALGPAPAAPAAPAAPPSSAATGHKQIGGTAAGRAGSPGGGKGKGGSSPSSPVGQTGPTGESTGGKPQGGGGGDFGDGEQESGEQAPADNTGGYGGLYGGSSSGEAAPEGADMGDEMGKILDKEKSDKDNNQSSIASKGGGVSTAKAHPTSFLDDITDDLDGHSSNTTSASSVDHQTNSTVGKAMSSGGGSGKNTSQEKGVGISTPSNTPNIKAPGGGPGKEVDGPKGKDAKESDLAGRAQRYESQQGKAGAAGAPGQPGSSPNTASPGQQAAAGPAAAGGKAASSGGQGAAATGASSGQDSPQPPSPYANSDRPQPGQARTSAGGGNGPTGQGRPTAEGTAPTASPAGVTQATKGAAAVAAAMKAPSGANQVSSGQATPSGSARAQPGKRYEILDNPQQRTTVKTIKDEKEVQGPQPAAAGGGLGQAAAPSAIAPRERVEPLEAKQRPPGSAPADDARRQATAYKPDKASATGGAGMNEQPRGKVDGASQGQMDKTDQEAAVYNPRAAAGTLRGQAARNDSATTNANDSALMRHGSLAQDEIKRAQGARPQAPGMKDTQRQSGAPEQTGRFDPQGLQRPASSGQMRQESDRNRGQRQQEETRGQKDIGGSNIPNIAEQKKQGQQTSYVPHETTSHKKPTLGGLEDSSMPDATLRSKDVPDMSESIANRLKDKGFSDKDYGEYAEARDNDYAMSYEDRRMEVGGIVDSEMDKKGKIMWEGPAMKKLDDAIMNKLRGPGPKKEEK